MQLQNISFPLMIDNQLVMSTANLPIMNTTNDNFNFCAVTTIAQLTRKTKVRNDSLTKLELLNIYNIIGLLNS